MAVFSNSGRVPACPPGFGRHLSDVASAMWASVGPWLPTRAGFWAITGGQLFVLARATVGPGRFRAAAA